MSLCDNLGNEDFSILHSPIFSSRAEKDAILNNSANATRSGDVSGFIIICRLICSLSLHISAALIFFDCFRSVYKELHADRETGC